MKKTIAIFGLGLMLSASAAFADIRVTATDALKNATAKPQPAYSPVARQMKVVGKVDAEAVIDTTGNVETCKAISGNPLLTQSAVSAVQKWKFTPFTADGAPTKAVVTLSFDFRP